MGIGIAELVLVALAAGLAAALLLVASRLLGSPGAPSEDEPPSSSSPLPIPTLAIGAAALLVSPVVGWMLAPLLTSFVTESLPSGMLVVTGPADHLRARLYAAAVIGGAVALPCALAIAWLLISSRRSTREAAALAGASAFGFSLMAAAALALASVALESMASTPVVFGQPLQLSLLQSVRMAARAALGAGLMGAAGGALLVMAAGSERGLRAAAWSTAALPLVAAVVAALATPPDVASQLLALPVLLAPWLIGVGVGWLLRRARRAAAGDVTD